MPATTDWRKENEETDMTKATISKNGFIHSVLFFDTNDTAKAEMLARMQAPRGSKIRIEIV
jgi:hypothetical protein